MVVVEVKKCYKHFIVISFDKVKGIYYHYCHVLWRGHPCFTTTSCLNFTSCTFVKCCCFDSIIPLETKLNVIEIKIHVLGVSLIWYVLYSLEEGKHSLNFNDSYNGHILDWSFKHHKGYLKHKIYMSHCMRKPITWTDITIILNDITNLWEELLNCNMLGCTCTSTACILLISQWIFSM